MGHPCCGVFRCTIPLAKMTDRFCPTHFSLHAICAVVGCDAPVTAGSKACNNAEHQSMEKAKEEKGKAFFTLKARLDRHRIAHPTNITGLDFNSAEAGVEAYDNLDEGETWFESQKPGVFSHHANPNAGSVGVVDDSSEIPCESQKSDAGNRKVKALFGRKRTHNEQTCVRPCGIIAGRATMFGAEAVSNVIVSLQCTSFTTYLSIIPAYGGEAVFPSESIETRPFHLRHLLRC